MSTPLQVRSFQKERSVTSAAVFYSTIETFDKPLLPDTTADTFDNCCTTAVNTDKKSGVN